MDWLLSQKILHTIFNALGSLKEELIAKTWVASWRQEPELWIMLGQGLHQNLFPGFFWFDCKWVCRETSTPENTWNLHLQAGGSVCARVCICNVPVCIHMFVSLPAGTCESVCYYCMYSGCNYMSLCWPVKVPSLVSVPRTKEQETDSWWDVLFFNSQHCHKEVPWLTFCWLETSLSNEGERKVSAVLLLLKLPGCRPPFSHTCKVTELYGVICVCHSRCLLTF